MLVRVSAESLEKEEERKCASSCSLICPAIYRTVPAPSSPIPDPWSSVQMHKWSVHDLVRSRCMADPSCSCSVHEPVYSRQVRSLHVPGLSRFKKPKRF